MTRLPARTALAVLVSVLGCGEEPGGPETCATLGCPAGSTCLDDVCQADAPDDYAIAARFVPAAGDVLSEWKHPEPRPLSEIGSNLPFSFHERVTVRGTVSAGAGALPAYVELRRDSPLPPRLETIAGRAVVAGESFAITVPLVEDVVDPEGGARAYRLVALSADLSAPFPPLRRSLAKDDLVVRQEIQVPELVAIRGVPLRSNGQRVANVRAVAVDPETGVQISTASTTSRVETDPDTGDQSGGEFRVLVPATTDAFAIRLSAEDNVGEGLPTIQFSTLSLPSLSIDASDGAAVIPLSVLVYPPITAVSLSGTVEGRPRAGGRVPLGQALLRLWSEDLGAPGVADVPGTFERILRSLGPSDVTETGEAATGRYSVGLLPAGTYHVEITPPATDELADLAMGVVEQFVNAPEPNGEQSGIVLEAPPRVAVGGTVVDGRGRPIEGARVELRGGGDRADVAAARAERWVRSATAVTSAEGAFFALVDPGHYDAVVRPPLAARLPWAIRLDLAVLEDMTLPEPLVVAPGRRLTGVVNDEGGAAVDVAVEIWCVTGTGASLVCGRTTTDAAGRYEVLLPAALD